MRGCKSLILRNQINVFILPLDWSFLMFFNSPTLFITKSKIKLKLQIPLEKLMVILACSSQVVTDFMKRFAFACLFTKSRVNKRKQGGG